jgi:hypothetical protein
MTFSFEPRFYLNRMEGVFQSTGQQPALRPYERNMAEQAKRGYPLLLYRITGLDPILKSGIHEHRVFITQVI